MQQIAARDGVGLKGFCPVALRDERRLADGRAAYVSYYRGKAYYLSSVEAKDQFDADPGRLCPGVVRRRRDHEDAHRRSARRLA